MTRKSVAYGFRRREIVIQSSEQAMYIKTGRQDRNEMKVWLWAIRGGFMRREESHMGKTAGHEQQYSKFNEATRVQMPALVHLTRIGYRYFGKISGDMAGTVYDGDTNILTEVFKE